MLGSGRPFLVEVLNARVIPTNADIMELETKINNSKDGIVSLATWPGSVHLSLSIFVSNCHTNSNIKILLYFMSTEPYCRTDF
jgi:hypothetical protein